MAMAEASILTGSGIGAFLPAGDRDSLVRNSIEQISAAIVPSQSQPQDAGGSSSGPSSTVCLATKHKRTVAAAKRMKSSTSENQHKSPTSSPLKRPTETNVSNLSNCIPVILDPRFKLKFVEFRLKKAFGDTAGVHVAKVDGAIRRLFSGYASEMRDENGTSTQANDSATSGKAQSWSDWRSHISAQSNQLESWSDWRSHINAQSNQITGELDRYLRDDLFPCDDDKFDILYWWKMHASKYPTVARMARDVLAVPASTVASESAFSTGGRVVTDHRTRLSSNTVEALICFQDWLRAAGQSYLDIIKIDTTVGNDEEFGPIA